MMDLSPSQDRPLRILATAITAAGLLILMLAAPVILHFWGVRLDLTLADPLALPR